MLLCGFWINSSCWVKVKLSGCQCVDHLKPPILPIVDCWNDQFYKCSCWCLLWLLPSPAGSISQCKTSFPAATAGGCAHELWQSRDFLSSVGYQRTHTSGETKAQHFYPEEGKAYLQPLISSCWLIWIYQWLRHISPCIKMQCISRTSQIAYTLCQQQLLLFD